MEKKLQELKEAGREQKRRRGGGRSFNNKGMNRGSGGGGGGELCMSERGTVPIPYRR